VDLKELVFEDVSCSNWKRRETYGGYFFYLLLFLQSIQDIKRVISKRDGCEYLKQVPSCTSDGSLELI
jgi:hypothetical protein